jgi:ATP-dependent helicase HrpA
MSETTEISTNKKARKHKPTPRIRISYNPDLPITAKKDEIIRAIRQNPVVIISGATGSGKTTQIPKFCIEAGCGRRGRRIGCTQPRRIAAITVANRIAEELNEPLGRSVGYKIRFDDKTPRGARIKIMTDGILLAETRTDPLLKAYDTIIVDEAHERSLNIDFTLGLLRRLLKRRKDLKLIITSATIDTEKFSEAFGNAPIIEVSGRMFPVDIYYRPYLTKEENGNGIDNQDYVEAAVDAIFHLLSTSRSGDILVFMPTEQDIGETLELIRGRKMPGITAMPLFARLSAREQTKVFSQQVGRKIIVATNVAETSLTIPGIKYVVDTGLARIPGYSPRTRTTTLPVTPISQSSANQRSGRCGRVENGVCIRLYDEAEFNKRPYFTAPQILRSNLAEVILRMISLNMGEVSRFPFIDPPSSKSIRDGFASLLELGAIEEKISPNNKHKGRRYGLTSMGKIMAGMPIDPKLSRILIEADKKACLHEAAVITTAMAVSDPRQRPIDKTQAADQKHSLFKDPSSDFVTLLNIWNAVKKAEKQGKSRSALKKFCQDHYLSFKRIREWADIHRQIIKILKEHGIEGKTKIPVKIGTKDLKAKEFELGGPLYIALHQSLLTGYLANIAHKKEKNIFNAAKGQQVMIFPGSGLFDKAGNWIVAAEFVKTSQVFARTVANIDPGWLEPIAKKLCTYTYFDPHWEKSREEVSASEQVSLFGLIIVNGRKVSYGRINPDEAGEIFIRHALVQGESNKQFEFMAHNQALIESLETLEHKTRKRDILVSEDDIFLFYRDKLSRPFSDIRSFARFIKEKNDPDFLKMTLDDLQKSSLDENTQNLYPDSITLAQGAKFQLEYEFNPGSKSDGVTVKVPVSEASRMSTHSLDRMVPGHFEEKIQALIRALPKVYRVKLVPVSEKAAIIASEMPKEMQGENRPLFAFLSSFIKERFHVLIPETIWSEKDLPDHLKMRISIRDEKGAEIKASRDRLILAQFADTERPPGQDVIFNAARKKFEKTGIKEWDFPDLEEKMTLAEEKDHSIIAYPGLRVEVEKDSKTRNPILCLRLFKSAEEAIKSHCEGIRHLFIISFPKDFKALEKDIRKSEAIRRTAPYFNGKEKFGAALFKRISSTYFAQNIRTHKDFNTHAKEQISALYSNSQEFIQIIAALGEEYQACFELIQRLSFQHQKKHKTSSMLSELFKELSNLIPNNFPELYSPDRIKNLQRFVNGIRIRAQRTVDNPLKEEKKILQLEKYTRRLNLCLGSLTARSSPEKAALVEDFFWLLEEYKISLFAPELKTRVKVSGKVLDTALARISNMI